jgi:hypothetical protein
MEDEEYYYQEGVTPTPQNAPLEEEDGEICEGKAHKIDEDEEFDFLGGEYY